jgi:hypothetical protein
VHPSWLDGHCPQTWIDSPDIPALAHRWPRQHVPLNRNGIHMFLSTSPSTTDFFCSCSPVAKVRRRSASSLASFRVDESGRPSAATRPQLLLLIRQRSRTAQAAAQPHVACKLAPPEGYPTRLLTRSDDSRFGQDPRRARTCNHRSEIGISREHAEIYSYLHHISWYTMGSIVDQPTV